MTSLPIAVASSALQQKLERQGCVFNGQELLLNHEENPNRACACGRPNRKFAALPRIKEFALPEEYKRQEIVQREEGYAEAIDDLIVGMEDASLLAATMMAPVILSMKAKLKRGLK